MPYREPADRPEKKDDSYDIGAAGFPWWRCPLQPTEGSPKPHELLDKLYDEVERDQSGRYEAYKEYERKFGSDTVQNGSDEALNLLLDGEFKQNELSNTLETLWAQVFKNKIVPAICVSEADYDEWFQAKAYGRWLEGSLDDGDTYSEAVPLAGIYSLVYGTGPIKVVPCIEGKKRAKIKSRAINPKYLMVDRLDARHGRPRTLFQKDHVDRWQACEEYGDTDCPGAYGDAEDREDGILSATANDDLDLPVSSVMKCDMLTIKEVWHLPSKYGAKDGRHCIWIKGCTLVYERWDWSDFPFVFIRFGSRLEGFWGESAVKRLAGIQEYLDKTNQKIIEGQDVMCVPRILARRGANIKKADIDDVPGGILECDDLNGIRDWTAQGAGQELYNDRDQAPQKMRSLLGVSDFEVQQQIPQGMRDVSGAFLERWVDQGQARHAMFHRQYEQAMVDLAYRYLDLATALEEDGYELVVHAPGTIKSTVESLKFSEVKVSKEKLKLRVLPMSQLPQTFAGKVEAVEKLKQLIPTLDPRTVARMVEVPDVSGTTDILVGDEEIIMKNIAFMVKKKKYLPPLPNDNHQLIIAMTTRFINCYRVKDDADEMVVGALLKYIEEAIQMQGGLGGTDANAPPAMGSAMPSPMGMPPGAPPMAPPGAGPVPPPMPGGPPVGPPPMGPEMPPMPPPGMPMQ